jgi:hypothetical protein
MAVAPNLVGADVRRVGATADSCCIGPSNGEFCASWSKDFDTSLSLTETLANPDRNGQFLDKL